MKKVLPLFITLFFYHSYIKAQTGKGQVVRINAVANVNGTITLKWPAESWAGTFEIARRPLGAVSWSTAASVAGTASTWTDNTVKKGQAYEYLIAKASGGNNSALGYIWAGNALPESPALGGIILLVDSAYLKTLAPELTALQKQLKEEGWLVSTLNAGRGESTQTVRNRIIAEYNRRKGDVKTLLIIGRVPVPYSGNYLAATGQVYPPDGHPDHAGAWPADGYYGDMDGVWTDASVNNTVGSARNHNIPGDGKYDPTKFPGAVELEVGRIDLFNMPAFSNNDTLLVRKYLRRNMLWRTNKLTTVERALIDDNFGSLNLSSTGFQNFCLPLELRLRWWLQHILRRHWHHIQLCGRFHAKYLHHAGGLLFWRLGSAEQYSQSSIMQQCTRKCLGRHSQMVCTSHGAGHERRIWG
jgi:hypothetical protein